MGTGEHHPVGGRNPVVCHRQTAGKSGKSWRSEGGCYQQLLPALAGRLGPKGGEDQTSSVANSYPEEEPEEESESEPESSSVASATSSHSTSLAEAALHAATSSSLTLS